MLTLGWCVAAWGAMTDPTLPAAAWLATQPKPPGVAAAEQDAQPVVQMLVIGKTQKYAIISGQKVRLGDDFRGSRLVEIKPDGVVLQNDSATQTLKTRPGIEKKVIAPKASGAAGKPASKGTAVVNGGSK